MDKKEAIEAIKEGKKVTHTYFSSDEWFTMKNWKIVFEDGCRCDPSEFWKYRSSDQWETGYSLWQQKENVKPF